MNELLVLIIMYLPTSSARMILVSLEGWVERAWRTALREQPLLPSSSTAWMLATSGLVEDLKNMTRKKKQVMYISGVAIHFRWNNIFILWGGVATLS